MPDSALRESFHQGRDLLRRFRYPFRCYVICAIPRSGSNLLSDGLRATDRAGRPQQFFSHLAEARYAERHHLAPITDYAAYARGIMQATATSNRVFGFKLMGWNVASFLARLRNSEMAAPKDASDLEILRAIFPRLQFIRLFRQDKLRQAISKARATQTGLWKVQPGNQSKGEPEFNPELIAQCLREEQIETGIWDRFFSESDVSPLVLEYGELCRDYRAVVASVLDFLEVPRRHQVKIAPPRTVKQGDALADDWEQRYRALPRPQQAR